MHTSGYLVQESYSQHPKATAACPSNLLHGALWLPCFPLRPLSISSLAFHASFFQVAYSYKFSLASSSHPSALSGHTTLTVKNAALEIDPSSIRPVIFLKNRRNNRIHAVIETDATTRTKLIYNKIGLGHKKHWAEDY
ncbi:unnamed protein product [Nezara viridula]|uniref:Uncharacterized protein n=1 Tax=Nezara viridula TaxID=85310 RepID=A0A9P0HHK9_NEZVI|nr:unnamed protein product [Nezara viridula]